MIPNRLQSLEQRQFFALERIETQTLKEMGTTGDRKNLLDVSILRKGKTFAYQLSSYPGPMVFFVHRQASNFSNSLGIDIKGAATDNLAVFNRNKETVYGRNLVFRIGKFRHKGRNKLPLCHG